MLEICAILSFEVLFDMVLLQETYCKEHYTRRGLNIELLYLNSCEKILLVNKKKKEKVIHLKMSMTEF